MSKTMNSKIERVMKSELPDAAGRLRERPDQSSIAARAYERWRERGFPEGSAEEDWFQAERELELSEAEETEAA